MASTNLEVSTNLGASTAGLSEFVEGTIEGRESLLVESDLREEAPHWGTVHLGVFPCRTRRRFIVSSLFFWA